MKNQNDTDGRYHRSDLPAPERVADKLSELSRNHDGVLSSDEQGWLQAADHYLREL